MNAAKCKSPSLSGFIRFKKFHRCNVIFFLKSYNKKQCPENYPNLPETFSLEYTQQGASPQAEISMCIQRPKYAQSYFLRVAS